MTNKIITPPIPDGLFIRGDVPMTKEEIRTLSISRLRLGRESVIVDIGAGTGSVSIECAMKADRGMVYAVEKNREAVELIGANKKKFMVDNVMVIQGEAPGALKGIGKFNRAFIGGSGGNLAEILEWVHGHIEDSGIISVNAVTLETASAAVKFYREKNYKMNIIQAAITTIEEINGSMMFRGQNPVFIISAEKG